MRLQKTNETLAFDVKSIMDNKQRIENENFMLKREIQRIRDKNQELQSKLGVRNQPSSLDNRSEATKLLTVQMNNN